jgi:phosphoglycolate phosphatase
MKKLVIFDFDGVIVDTEELCYKIHKDVNGNLTWEQFQEFSEGNFHEGMEKAVKENSYIIPHNFFELYEKGLSVISIHDIIRDSIVQLSKKDTLAIVSACGSLFISNFLEKENLTECFGDILGYEVHTSKVIKIASLLKKYNVNSNDAVFITDTLGDILEAKKCSVKSIGVTWGLHGKETLEKGNPVAIINDPRDLVNAIESVLI